MAVIGLVIVTLFLPVFFHFVILVASTVSIQVEVICSFLALYFLIRKRKFIFPSLLSDGKFFEGCSIMGCETNFASVINFW